eukprot:6201121-Pleurochrysis_carterae.AAC.1
MDEITVINLPGLLPVASSAVATEPLSATCYMPARSRLEVTSVGCCQLTRSTSTRQLDSSG